MRSQDRKRGAQTTSKWWSTYEKIWRLWRRSWAWSCELKGRGKEEKYGSKVLGTEISILGIEISSNGHCMKSLLLRHGEGSQKLCHSCFHSIQVSYAPIWYSVCCTSDSPGSGTGLKKSRHHKTLLNKKMNQYTDSVIAKSPELSFLLLNPTSCRGRAASKRKQFVTDALKLKSTRNGETESSHWLWKQPLFHLGAMEALCLLPSWSFRFLSPRVLRLTLGIWFLRELRVAMGSSALGLKLLELDLISV